MNPNPEKSSIRRLTQIYADSRNGTSGLVESAGRTFAVLLCLASALYAGTPAEKPVSTPAPATLRWNNGETVTGEPIAASATSLTWKTPLFEDPLVLGWHALRRIDRPVSAVSVTDSFSVTLRDGSIIYGDLVSVTDNLVTIHSVRNGDAVLKRSEVLRMQRIRGGSVVFTGPVGTEGWTPEQNSSDPNSGGNGSESAPKLPLLNPGPGGVLLMPYWNRGASLKLALPDLVEFEFRVSSSSRLEFGLSLGDDKGHLRIETWDDDLVLTASNEFKTICKIGENERKVALRLCWDRNTRNCSIYAPSGKLITQWQPPEEKEGKASGLVLQNKGGDLSLEFLRVRAWNGKPPLVIDAKESRIELADGQILQGKITSGSAGFIALYAHGADSEQSVALKDVDALIFSDDSPRVSEHEVTLRYADGMTLMGRVLAIKDGSITLETSFAKEPLISRIDALHQLLIRVAPPGVAAPEPPLSAFDKIIIEETKMMHGKLVGTGEDWPRWLPVGGLTPAIPSKKLPSEIIRAIPADVSFPSAQALFYINGGDVLPGVLHGIDRSGVDFESSITEVTKLSAEELDAIQFGPAVRMNLKGFGDSGWRILKGDEKTVKRENDSLNMDPETAIGHSSAMQSREIGFTIDSNSVVRLHLFCDGTDGARSSNLVFSNMNMGDTFVYGMESSEGQLENQVQTKVASSHVAVRLVIHEQQVEVYVNEVLGRKFMFPPEKRSGGGLIIEPASLWGNNVTPIALSNFSVTSEPGCALLPNVDLQAKTQALTVPRFRKDDPPRQALLAVNGDVLRGEIEAVTASHLAFRSGLETLRVPIERVKAAIWLKKPGEKPTASVEKSGALKRLDQTIEQRMGFGNARLKTFINCLQRQAPDLKFEYPEKDERRYSMQFGGETIGEVLNRVCALFSLHYRLGSDDTIILESAPTVSTELVQKVYWLKADAFPNTASAQEILAGKGIDFPPKAAAFWNPDSRQLSMTNTVENHGKLAELLTAEFGGALGTPTHWLILTNGARLGLAVDKFENDSISGRHPVYGCCKVPMSDVYIVRTSMPEPSAAMKSLGDWRLVFAPEPVLPEPGGDSSAMLGKPAKTFKLPLLGGGDFDLGHEKGKIVVLDFWATWCGPCVRSLPDLMEALSMFPAERVKFVGVNQGEPKEQVKRFLETRGWELTVAMDMSQSVARSYGVDAIPQTVVIGPDGKIAWVKTGYSPDGEKELADAVSRLLATPPAP